MDWHDHVGVFCLLECPGNLQPDMQLHLDSLAITYLGEYDYCCRYVGLLVQQIYLENYIFEKDGSCGIVPTWFWSYGQNGLRSFEDLKIRQLFFS